MGKRGVIEILGAIKSASAEFAEKKRRRKRV